MVMTVTPCRRPRCHPRTIPSWTARAVGPSPQEDEPMFPITDDQKALVDAVRDFAEQRVAPHALDWDAE